MRAGKVDSEIEGERPRRFMSILRRVVGRSPDRRFPWAAVVFAVFAAAYLPLARFGVDPHHDGLMLKPALVVADGGVIHRDVFSQYGPMASWVHALWVVVLGPTLWAIRTGTALMLVTAATLLFVAWRRAFGQGVALVAISCAFLLTPHFSPEYSPNPWSADVAFLFLSLLALVLTTKWRPPFSPSWGYVTAGALVGATSLARLNVGLMLAVLLGLRELFSRRVRPLALFVAGFMAVVGLAALSLGLNGALDEWWFQSIVTPRSTIVDFFGPSGGFFIRQQVWFLAIPSAAFVLLTVAAVGGGMEKVILPGKVALLRVAAMTVISTTVVVYHRGWSLPGWNRWDACWVLIIMTIGGAPLFLRWWKDRAADRPSIGIHNDDVRMSVGLWLVALAALVQIYPMAGPRYLWWAAVPALGPVVHLLKKFTLPGSRRALVGVLAVAILVPSAAQSLWRTVNVERVSIENIPVLDHMLADTQFVKAHGWNLNAVQGYLEREGNPPIMNMCQDGLYSTLSAHQTLPDPYFVFWAYPRDVFDYAARDELVYITRPIMWWCPPAPDPYMIANGWGMRLLPVDPAIRDDPTFEAWPLVGRVAVPSEWAPLPGELPFVPDEYDADLWEEVERALEHGFFNEIDAGSTVVFERRRNLVGDNGFLLRYFERDRNLRFVESMPEGVMDCGAGLCDADGRPIVAFEIIPSGDSAILILGPIRSQTTEGHPVLDLSEALFFGPAERTPLCDFPATIDHPLNGLKGAEGWSLRRCSSGPETSLADVVSWVSDGCAGRPGWWLCSPPIDEELREVTESAAWSGLFEGLIEPATVILGDIERWKDADGLFLERLDEAQGVRFVGGLPGDAVSCGGPFWCDADERPLYVLRVVDHREGPVLLLGLVVDVDTSSNQVVVELDHVRLAGPADDTPLCDFVGDMTGTPEAGSSAVVVRYCSGAPVGLDVVASWVSDGCAGRPGWWLCSPPIDEELRDVTESAAGSGLFEGLIEPATVIVGDIERWKDADGLSAWFFRLFLERLDEAQGVRFVGGLPGDAVSCGGPFWCDADGRFLYVLRVVDHREGPVLLLGLVVDVDTSSNQVVVVLDHVRLAGRADDTPLCDFVGDMTGTPEAGSSAVVVRYCSGAPVGLDVVASWVADGCAGRPGWWLCSPPIDEELRDVTESAAGSGLFEGLIEPATVIVGDIGRWQDSDGLFLERLDEAQGVRFVGGLPGDVVSCGGPFWCDADGRFLYVLRVVDHREGPVLLLGLVVDVDTSSNQVVVVLDHVRLAGRADDTPLCDFVGDMTGTPEAGSSAVVVRYCSGAPVGLDVVASWVADGCVDRPGWWLCP